MKRIKIALFLVVALGFAAFVPTDGFLDKLAELFIQYNKKCPKETVYLQVDKNFYQAGDSLWFKGYVVNKTTRNLSGVSNTLTTVLVDEKGKEVVRNEFLIIDGEVVGNLDIPKELEKGNYKLVAYTSWMRNYEPDEVFSKDILIKEDIPGTNYFRVSFDKKQYKPNESGNVDIASTTSKSALSGNVNFEYQVCIGNRTILRNKAHTGNDGHISLHFSLPKVIDSLPTIKIFNTEKGAANDLFSIIPTTYLPKIDLQFFPEGGDAVANLSNKIAFKTVSEMGLPINIKGELVDSKGAVVSKFEGKNLGLGAFNFKPVAGETYKARITEPQGYASTYAFPEIKKEGYVLTTESTNPNFVSVKIKCSENGVAKKGYLAMQMMGALCYTNDVELTDSTSLVIPSNLFAMGIAQLTYFDEKETPRAERLIFLNKNKKVNITVENLKDEYTTREQVALRIKATDENGEPTQAVLSMAVADSLLGLSDNTDVENILASMTFRPYLKGKINNPNFYFQNSPQSDEAMDLLMLTQGWRRFDWANFTAEKINALPKPVNFEQVSGTVYKNMLTKKPASKALVNLVQLKGAFETIPTDENGRFKFIPTYESFNSSQFILFAKSANGKDNVTLVLDENGEDVFGDKIPNLFPAYSYDASKRAWVKNNPDENPLPQRDPHFDANTHLLASVAIKAKQNSESGFEKAMLNSVFTISKRGSQLQPAGNFRGILEQVTTIYSYDDSSGVIQIRRDADLAINMNQTTKGVLFVVNGADYGKDYHNLDFVSVDNIKEIKVLKGEMGMAQFGLDAGYGVVYVTLKKAPNNTQRDKNVGVPQTKNYEYVREFYAPKYDTEKALANMDFDIRRTIHWLPSIKIGDSGETVVRYYNSDIKGKAVGTIEGIGAMGRLAHQKFRYEVVMRK